MQYVDIYISALVTMFIYHNIFGLDVPVHYILLVAILDSPKDLPEDLPQLIFINRLFFPNNYLI